jgi:hypothetical protein
MAALLLLASCGKDEAEVIPRGKLSEIYAEMLMTDQWITSTPGFRHIADTSLVYEPILEKYGYDSEDYRKTVDVYMDDPERFSRILRATVAILDERLEELREQQRIHEEEEARKKRLEKLRYDSDLNISEYFPCLFDEPYVHYYDSVTFEPDSLLWVYRLHHVPATDTLYEGPRMTVAADTVAVADSVAAVESKVLEEKKQTAKADESQDEVKSAVDKQNINRVIDGKFLKSSIMKDLKSK